mgnify:CR=1 FL=1
MENYEFIKEENQTLKKLVQELQSENKQLKSRSLAPTSSQEQAFDDLEYRLQVEEQLKESQERFVTVFEKSRVANKIINMDLKMTQINEALCTLLGYSKEELLGTTILNYTHPDFIKYWFDMHEALWKQELPSFSLEACLIKKDKSHVWVLVNTIRFRDKGETLGYTNLQDITERKQLDRHKDEFIGTISHELKTPLTSIKSYAQMLLRYFNNLEDQKPKDMLKRMDSKVNDLTRLIKDLVMASKIDAGKLTPRSDDYFIDELVADIANEYGATITSRNIRIVQTEPLKTKGDKYKIGQVVENLLTNAVKFSKDDTDINISLEKKDNEAVVCIQDFGRGIAKESLEHIFARFYKVKEAESNVESGMGLGLYICKEIVTNQQGRLWVNSEEGKGSEFSFTLPIIE